MMSGKDGIVQAWTDTGQTLSFSLTIVERLQRERLNIVGRPPRCLLLESTRELARQVRPRLFPFFVFEMRSLGRRGFPHPQYSSLANDRLLRDDFRVAEEDRDEFHVAHEQVHHQSHR